MGLVCCWAGGRTCANGEAAPQAGWRQGVHADPTGLPRAQGLHGRRPTAGPLRVRRRRIQPLHTPCILAERALQVCWVRWVPSAVWHLSVAVVIRHGRVGGFILLVPVVGFVCWLEQALLWKGVVRMRVSWAPLVLQVRACIRKGAPLLGYIRTAIPQVWCVWLMLVLMRKGLGVLISGLCVALLQGVERLLLIMRLLLMMRLLLEMWLRCVLMMLVLLWGVVRVHCRDRHGWVWVPLRAVAIRVWEVQGRMLPVICRGPDLWEA